MKKYPPVEYILNALPLPVFIIAKDMRIVEMNRAASAFSGASAEGHLFSRWGETLHCINRESSREECGTGKLCSTCLIRSIIESTLAGGKIVRRQHDLILKYKERIESKHFLLTASPFHFGEETYAMLILEDITELKELKRLLPICSNCNRIRTEDEKWENLENYLSSKTGIDFSHGLCPECMKKLYS